MNLPPLPTIPRLRNGEVQIRDFTLLEMQEYAKSHGQVCYEKALLEAMNATLPFDKVGRVIAAAIGALK